MATVKSSVKKVQFVTPEGKAIFPHISAPDTEGKFADGKFKVQIEWMANDPAVQTIRDMVKKAVMQERGDVDYADPFREGKDKYADRVYLTAKTKQKPTVVDAKRKPLADVNMGDIVKVAVTIGLFDLAVQERVNGKKVSIMTVTPFFWLNAVQVIERGNSRNAADLFSDEEGFEGDDEDAENDAPVAAKPAVKTADVDDGEMPF